MSRRVHVATFDNGHELVAAARACRRRGLQIADAHTPHPVHGLEEALGLPRSRLPIVCFVGGFVGLTLGLAFQHWASAVDWPLNVGGKPFSSWPAFLPVAFEMTVLVAGLATAAALLLRSRLLPGTTPSSFEPRATDDRYVLIVQERDATLAAGELRALLLAHGALACREELSAEEVAT